MAAAILAAILAAADCPAGSWITFEEMSRARFKAGDEVEVAGRYVEMQDGEITLFGAPAHFVVSDAKLLRDLLTTAATHENLTLQLRCTEASGPRPRFEVTSVSPGPPSGELVDREIEKLRSRGDSPLLFELAQRLSRMEKELRRPEFRELTRKVCNAIVETEEKRLAPADLSSRLGTVERLYEMLQDRELAMSLLVDLDRRFPESNDVIALLIKLDCRKYHGKWMTYAEFKDLQGYEQFNGRWVSRLEKQFLQTIDAYLVRSQDSIIRRKLDKEYKLISGKGQVITGMKSEEVYEALGYPDRVYRKALQGKSFTQWVYDSNCYYFLDDILIRTPDDDSELR